MPPSASNGGGDILYVVFVPSTFTGFAYNSSFSCAPGFTHELAEAISQNVQVSGCAHADDANNQIGSVSVATAAERARGGSIPA